MKTIIHVEDSELILLRLAEWVVEIDPSFNILPATSLVEAETLLRSHNPDFMVLDVNLPDGNALNRLKDFKRLCPHMQVAILTNSNDTFTRLKCKELGADWVFDKATDIPKLVELMSDTVTQHGTL
ncbi:MAG: response regulator [Rhodoferax sp.]|nr:MAG: response regulator [Rhodoferax sp.]